MILSINDCLKVPGCVGCNVCRGWVCVWGGGGGFVIVWSVRVSDEKDTLLLYVEVAAVIVC